MTQLSPYLPMLMSVADAARHLGINPRTVSRFVEAGQLSRVRIGGRVLIESQSVLAMIEAGRGS